MDSLKPTNEWMLKNFVWHSLEGMHKHLSLGKGLARRYQPLVLLCENISAHNGEWSVETQTPVLQMILPTMASSVHVDGLRPRTSSDVSDMLELTHLVLQGYFLKRSIEMGTFFGIFDQEKLVAMTGERMFPGSWREITAVCTHPDYEGRGLASRLIRHVAFRMTTAGLTPFLHTAVTNSRAIELYRRLGFKDNGLVLINGIRRL